MVVPFYNSEFTTVSVSEMQCVVFVCCNIALCLTIEWILFI